MRLARLELTRYGRFQDAVLDFGDAGDGPDVAIVFGPNEAGKSTAFSAWLDLLFGMPLRQPYAFRFERGSLLVGAALDTPEGRLVLRRTGKRTGSLTDADGREVAEHRLAGLLRGLGRDAYRTRFSLDDATLREGGEEIARAQGDLGRLLHAGTSGLAGVSEALDAVRGEVEAFYLKGGSRNALASGKRTLEEVERRLKEARLTPERDEALSQGLQRAGEDLREAREALDAARRAVALHKAARARRACRGELRAAEEALAALPDGPPLPDDAKARVERAMDARARAEADARAARAAMEGADAALAGLEDDPAGLALAQDLERIEALLFEDGQPLAMRAAGAQADLERRRVDRDRALANATASAEQLRGPGADSQALALPEAVVEELKERLTALRDAERDAGGAREALEDARAARGDEPEAPGGLDALEAALDALGEAENPGEAGAEAEEAESAARQAEAGLPVGWREAAARGVPPVEALAALAERDREARRALDAARSARAEAEEAQAMAAAARDAARSRPEAVSVEEVEAARAARDAAWTEHRGALEGATADAFHGAMRRDDAVGARHAAGAEARAALAAAERETGQADARLRTRRGAEASATEAAETARSEVARHAGALLLPPDAPGAALAARATDLVAALHAEEAAGHARRRAQDLRAAWEERLSTLCAALVASGAEPCDGDPVASARARRAALRGTRAAHEAWTAGGKQVAVAQRRLEGAERRRVEAAHALDRAREGLWCASLPPERLRATLAELGAMAAALREACDLARRVGEMEAALLAFETASEPLRALLPEEASAEVLLRRARARWDAAREVRARIDRAREARVAAEAALAGAEGARAAAEAAIAAVLDGQADDPASPDRRVATLLERDELRRTVQRLRGEIEATGEGHDPDALAGEEVSGDPARGAALEDAVAAAEAARDEALRREGEARRAQREARAGQGGATADQERAALLEELREGARAAAARLLGLMAARAGLRRLREERRGPMLEDAEAAFARLTQGEWTRLQTWADGTDERLVGVREGAPVRADGMSTGTRGQLYLALRLAGHAGFVREHGPLPFVTDDILESFDDGRAAAALELTAELGRRGQAIVFTHHAHLVAMARERIEGVRVLEMPV